MAQLRTLQAERKYAPVEAQSQQYLNARLEGGNDDPAGDPPPESARFSPARQSSACQSSPARQGGDQPLGFVSSSPIPDEIPNEIPNKINDKIDPSQRPGRAPEPRAKPARPRRRTHPLPPARRPWRMCTTSLGGIPTGEWVRNPLGQSADSCLLTPVSCLLTPVSCLLHRMELTPRVADPYNQKSLPATYRRKRTLGGAGFSLRRVLTRRVRGGLKSAAG
jgi:hypothetical protein